MTGLFLDMAKVRFFFVGKCMKVLCGLLYDVLKHSVLDRGNKCQNSKGEV